MMGDDSVEIVACVGANLKSLIGTRVSSARLGILAGHIPEVQILYQKPMDDTAIS